MIAYRPSPQPPCCFSTAFDCKEGGGGGNREVCGLQSLKQLVFRPLKKKVGHPLV